MMKLYHNDMSTCAQKVRATLAEKDLVWDGHELNLRTGEQHRPQFLKLNPRGVVPVLVHDGNVIIESNIIMEYLEDAFPDTKRLMPSSAVGKAAVRNLLQRLDTALHLHIATISVGIAFRDQLLAVHKNDQALESFYSAVPDPRLQSVYRDVVPGPKASGETRICWRDCKLTGVRCPARSHAQGSATSRQDLRNGGRTLGTIVGLLLNWCGVDDPKERVACTDKN
jgi:hypothetical protein